MAYLGVTPKIGNIRKLDDIAAQFNGVAVTFNLRVGGQVIFPGSPLQMLISLGGVMQEANVAFQINNDTLTFSDPPNPGIDFFGLIIGDTIDVGEPSDGTVNAIKLNQGATFTMGGLEVTGDVNLDSTTLVIDKINHRVGLGTANPTTRLHVSAGDIYLDDARFIDFGAGATRANIQGNPNQLVLRSQQNNLTGSIQCSATSVIVNDKLTFDDSSASASLIKTASTAIHFEANFASAATPQITVDDTLITLARNTSVTGNLVATGNIKTNDTVSIGTTNNSDHINITDKTGISAGTLTTTSATEVFDTLIAGNVRGANYTVYASHGGHVSTSQVIVTHDGTDAFVTMFGDIHSNPGNAVATFSAAINGSNLELSATGTIGTFIQFTRTTMNV
tara:strand:- start:3735 stop:4910 length:1176 start_codon:yes stop_codon:yes gene_type:complete